MRILLYCNCAEKDVWGLAGSPLQGNAIVNFNMYGTGTNLATTLYQLQCSSCTYVFYVQNKEDFSF